ncbi:MAG: hypothetical protein H7Y13_06345 [Sphingobacteriaceae bacterium]|nr:hypothetical protein [Sphingobacteriaceae bacterium]
MNLKNLLVKAVMLVIIAFHANTIVLAQENSASRDLSKFNFFYAGEGKIHNMYIVKDGKIAWSYTNLDSKGEISDAVLLKNGNILFAHQTGVSILTPAKKIIWNYPAPQNAEIHTAVPAGKDLIVFVMNANPAKVIVMNYVTNKIVKEFNVPVGNPKGIHGHFRHARLTDKGTLLIAHMDMAKVNEYDTEGKILLSLDVPRPWSVEPLKNGNILVCSASSVLEINRKGETIWEVDTKSIKGYDVSSPQVAQRLANGNILFNNWFNQWGTATVDLKNPPIQALEITPDKKVVWALSSWAEPANLGPSTIIQLLENTGELEKMRFGKLK